MRSNHEKLTSSEFSLADYLIIYAATIVTQFEPILEAFYMKLFAKILKKNNISYLKINLLKLDQR